MHLTSSQFAAELAEARRDAEFIAELGERVQIDGEWWVQYDVPELGRDTKFSLLYGSTVERLTLDKQREAERAVNAIYASGREPSPGYLVYLGLAIPRGAGIKWEEPF